MQIALKELTRLLVKDLPDWSNFTGRCENGMLRSVKASTYGHFVVMEIQNDGGKLIWNLLEVGRSTAPRVVSLLAANLGRRLSDIANLSFDDD